jgi:pyruvate formate-lyase activating enzyme-like uncharacterized protein
MQIIPIQQVYQEKFNRQKKVEELSLSKDGLCAHLGKLSPGCFWCLSSTSLSYGVRLGSDAGLPDLCNLECTYCFKRKPKTLHYDSLLDSAAYTLSKIVKDRISSILEAAKNVANHKEFTSFAFSGDGAEPLLYMPVIRSYMNFYKYELEPLLKTKTWYKIYTNGILADCSTITELYGLGINEVRFHIGASDFAGNIIQNIRNAVKIIPTVTIETPAWPLHRKKIFQFLPVFEDIGIKHLNLIEVAVTNWNFDEISRNYMNARVYHSYIGLALYDEGLVYDVMDEVSKNKFSYSVLDCNTFIRKVRDHDTYDSYFRGALRRISYGNDWGNTGRYPV